MYYASVRNSVLSYIHEHALLKPGDRVGIAVSGGADSAALLRALLELRSELGLVLSVLHFNHKIRGADADADERFVASLAKHHDLDFHSSSADVPAYAAEHRLSLETAGRQARYSFFESFFHNRTLDAVATGHTMDDQAETVLMRVLRGAGTTGLGGIFPAKNVHDGQGAVIGRIVRPLLAVRRAEVRSYLQEIRQSWREDSTNQDLQYTRNRIRHGLIPLIETRFQPNVVQALGHLAEVAREEEKYWQDELGRVLPEVLHRVEAGSLTFVLDLTTLLAYPRALQRRIVRECAQLAGFAADFEHLEKLLRLSCSESGKEFELPGNWVAIRGRRELRLELRSPKGDESSPDYEYRLPVPGEVEVREIGRVFRAFLRPVKPGASGYNREKSLDLRALAPELVVRNWRPGDRFWPAHSKAPKKMKELFQERRVAVAERRSWPVVASGDQLVWSRGFDCSTEFQPSEASKEVVVIEEHVRGSRE